MKMIRFDDLQLFVRTAALGSFSQAAREADLLPGQVAAAVARLERELDLRLFVRTTRSLRLTGEGALYLPYAQEVLATLREGQARVQGEDTELHGILQLSAPSDFGRNLLLPWLSAFRAAHPRLRLHLRLSDEVADVFREPVDVAIRIGHFDDANYVALPLLEGNRRVLAASPGYLQRRGPPTRLEDLREHDCLIYQLNGRAYDRWSFEVDGRRSVVPVRGPLVCDDADVVRRWAVAGEGITYKSWLDLREDVLAGRLQVLLDGVGSSIPLQLVCPHRKQFSPAVRQLHAQLRQHLQPLLSGMPVGPTGPLSPAAALADNGGPP
ncbi:LysR family transcriptional regulator [Stenotrophomonas maltophilia]|uniref:LysR family transcriptional regulator n=1 Tax=Stenotrophomonas maltophilia TaxID=40324 RepID=A0AA40Y8F7_STEMA|nr:MULTISPECIES: LysR family transcriptional regulator [Stenotrophomonas]AWB80595.1 LysR family transcriptional regulator [Stenotrophomonas maltophilia]KOO85186.1 LysR family transcriptional regulator [Stenotrophomonas maltophilia]MBH1586010.1 LysR family transcriptional regulator [Stenotrophomonas maltophilia]MBH1716801.1 LysR family transcriptional regulator [Stenotrophomonas maltophilia]MBH1791824.1 LysR family transcriptional regulator [Stenotrophomonas maltophilia]